MSAGLESRPMFLILGPASSQLTTGVIQVVCGVVAVAGVLGPSSVSGRSTMHMYGVAGAVQDLSFECFRQSTYSSTVLPCHVGPSPPGAWSIQSCSSPRVTSLRDNGYPVYAIQ